MGNEWRTFHTQDGYEMVLNVFSISAVIGREEGSLIVLANGESIGVEEDITEVKAEMFI